MRATPNLLAKGFLGRSVDELKRLSDIVFKLEGIKGPSGPYQLFNFHAADSVNDCKVMSDVNIGGVSTAHLDWVPPPAPSQTSSHPKGHARFHGTISTQLPKDRPDIKRTGFAAFRTHDRGATIFGRSLWNIDPYTYLALRVKTDGRAYFVNVQTEGVVPTDLHQHRLFTKKPGEWETVLIRWNDFVRTNHGFVVEPQTEIMREKVKSVGIGLTDRIPGPFEMCIERVWATNDLSETDAVGDPAAPGEKGDLKTKQGQKVGWGQK
ncbi:complex I intermediate-associated protein 30-domain-containing protein [Cercophora newfieldiana]|uniref:Complex I intermediate-associated protein 30-domain-containing protein n=1 Tax=Cercophora newfieldiana TaxID=92897 RepID=A0AA39YRY0_9PEZI|nr:complex I intermediate-associated protein 30-domain-containing protein [Cercophora newfieldiana]